MSRLVQAIVVTLAVALAALAAPRTAESNPLDAFGFGARGVALAGAMSALAVDYSANYYNPAGLAAANDLRIEFGYMYVDPSLRIGEGDVNVDRSYGVQGGIVMPGQIGGRTLAFSVGTFVPAERISRIRALPQRQPRWTLYDNRPQRIVITTSAAAQILDNLYLGLGLTYLSNTEGSLDMSGLVNFSDADETALFSGVDVNLTAVRYLSAGVLFTPGERWRFAVAFRDEFQLRLALAVNVQGDVTLQPNAPPAVQDATFNVVTTNVNLFSPRQLTLGIAYDETWWRAAIDVAWHQWSRFPPPASTLDIELDIPGFDFSVPPGDVPLDPSFRNIVITRVGAEFDVLDTRHVGLSARGGVFYEPSPAPHQPGLTNYVDTAKIGFSVGAGWLFREFSSVFPKPILFDLAGLVITLPEREYTKSSAADPVGDYSARGLIWGFSTSISLLF